MTDNASQIHARPLEVNAHALDSAYRAWLATRADDGPAWLSRDDGPEWQEYKAIRHAYCAKLQKQFEIYQNAAWEAWFSLRRFRDPGRKARKAYLKRMIEEATARLEKLNADPAGPSSEVVEAWYALERAKFDLEVASFPIRSRHLIPVRSRAEIKAARVKSDKFVKEWFEARRVEPLIFEDLL